MTIRIARFDFAGPVRLSCNGDDMQGLKAPEVTLAAGEMEATMKVTAERAAAPGKRTITVNATPNTGKIPPPEKLTIEVKPPELKLAVPQEMIVYQGSSNKIAIKIARLYSAGPVNISCAGDLQGLKVDEVSVYQARRKPAGRWK